MNDVESIEKIHNLYVRFLDQASRIIVGQTAVLEELFIALLSGGHCLLEGAPGLGKTLMVRTLAETLSLEFQRIQCTPDLMPGDITGSEIFRPFQDRVNVHENEDGDGNRNGLGNTLKHGNGNFVSSTAPGAMHFLKGPVFTNILLADEINRTPPRTQSALLEAMQEHQVTAGRHRFPLPAPFFVLATQNPIEQEGTYPLPEAQLDRFMFKSRVTYPTRQDELDILLQTTGTRSAQIEPVLTREELLDAMELVRRVPVSGPAAEFALDVCRATRPDRGENAPVRSSADRGAADRKMETDLNAYIREYAAWGAGPRAGQALLLGARARAVLHGRFSVEREDIRSLAPPVLRHRIQTRFSADAQGITPDHIVEKILTFLENFGKV